MSQYDNEGKIIEEVNIGVLKIQGKQRPRTVQMHTYSPKNDFELELEYKLKKVQLRTSEPITLEINLSGGKIRSDVDNVAKSIMDTMQKLGIVENDKQIKDLKINLIEEPTSHKLILNIRKTS